MNMYFMTKGEACYVLPSYQNNQYVRIQMGDHFGLIDLILCSQRNHFDINNFLANRNKLQR
jgi:hypothetical protein